MQGGRGGGRGNFFRFGDPFAGFGDPFAGFGDPFAGFGGFGGHGSLISSVFGGRDPFDDPFFPQPFGGIPFRSMFQSSLLGAGGSPFVNTPAGFLGHQQSIPHAHAQVQPQTNRHRGPIIEELDSDDEKSKDDGALETKDNPRKLSRSGREPYVEVPDDDAEEERNRQIQFRNEYNRMNSFSSQPQSQSFTFHSSSVTYGGTNGSYYTKSSIRRSGSDGVTFEEHKEADSTTGQAFHQVSRGLHYKGHTLERNLNSDGRVDTMQTLHNLNEDELTGFEEAWKGKARKHLPGIGERFNGYDNIGVIGGGRGGQMGRGGLALPSTEQPQPQQNVKRARIDPAPAANTTVSQPQCSGKRTSSNGSRGKNKA